MNRTPRLSKSAIEYLDHVWNFASGCTKDCAYCWARKITCRFADRYPNGFEPTVYPEAFLSPLHLKKPSIVGCVFMGDLFDPGIDPYRRIDSVMPSGLATVAMSLRGWIFTTIKQCPQHRFLFLTKQPQNLTRWAPFPDNCWVGVSVTEQARYDEAIAALAGIEATVKYISFEPLLEEVMVHTALASADDWTIAHARLLRVAGINWVIIGAQTKPYIAPKVERVREIVEAADKAGVPVVLKGKMEWHLPTDEPFYKYTYPSPGATAIGRLRQEMPTDG